MQSSTHGSLFLALECSQSSEGGMEVRLNLKFGPRFLRNGLPWSKSITFHSFIHSHHKTINSNVVMLNDSDLRAQRYNATRRWSDHMGGKIKYEKPGLRIQKANIVACM